MEKKGLVKFLPAVFFVAVAASAYLHTLPTTRNFQAPWYGAVVTPEEVEAALWVNENIERKKLFAGELFACEMLVSAGGALCAIGGAWELADRPNQRFQDNERVFLTQDAVEAHGLLAKYAIKYVFLHPRNGFYAYGWKNPETAKFNNLTYFTPVYDYGKVKIYLVN